MARFDGMGAFFDPFEPWHIDLELILILVVAIVLSRRFPDAFNLRGIRPILQLLLTGLLTWTAYVATFLLATHLQLSP